jgi:hypothetical protein
LVKRARTAAALLALLCGVAGCGSAASQPGSGSTQTSAAQSDGIPTFHPHPQAVAPVSSSGSAAAAAAAGDGGVSVQTPDSGGLRRPASLSEVKQQLSQSGLSADQDTATLTPQGLAIAPLDAPPEVQEAIDAGNEIAHLPYRFGGGHGTFIDTAYDCSGSLSFIFAAAGLLNTTMTSGEFAHWGDAGQGRWITVFANDGHTFAYIAGLRFDTVALAQGGSRWSNRAADESDLHSFVIRHPAGL